MTLQDRAKRIQSVRYVYNTEFDDPGRRGTIMADMPEFQEFLRKKSRIRPHADPVMRPFYVSPLLTPAQEMHLFRKMNYLKHLARKLAEKPNKKNIDRAEKLLAEAQAIRNQIAESNFRLCVIERKAKVSHMDEFLSDGCTQILKAVDYFDYAYGTKFSTYSVWVLRRNRSRERRTKMIYRARFKNVKSQNFDPDPQDWEEGVAAGDTHDDVERILGALDRAAASDPKLERERAVVTGYFGLRGSPRKTLNVMGQEMGVSKERARQLRNNGVKILQDAVTTATVV